MIWHWAQTLMHAIRTHDYLAMYLVLSVEEGGLPLPLPGDTIVAYAGYLTSMGRMVWWLVMVVAVGASLTGSLPLYWLARSKGRPALKKYGKYLHLTPSRERRIEGWLQRHGGVAVFVGRLVPGLRVGTTAIAGVFEIPFWVFVSYLTASAILWWGFWLWLGSVVGRRIAPLVELSPVHFVIGAAGIVIIAGGYFYLRHMAAEKPEPAPASHATPASDASPAPVLHVTQPPLPAGVTERSGAKEPLLPGPTAVED